MESLRLAGGGLAAAIAFLPAAWRGAWAALVLFAVAVTGITSLQPQGVAVLTAAVFGILAEGALWRLALGAPGRGPGGLQWRAIELRLLAVAVLRLAFVGVLAILLFVTVLMFAYAAAASGRGFVAGDVSTWAPAVDARGRIVVTAVAAAGALAVAWAAARIALAEVATVARGAVRVLSVWRATRGLGLPILLASAVLAAPPVAVWLGLRGLIGAGPPPPWAAGVEGFVIAGLWLPMSVGLMAYVHDNRAVSDA